ncbi:MAG: DegT/DnrJ/EryC1/StrS family aminotransferase, partial [Spirochaetaceae bacterium]|nr:DegT/DnrJ/EryC1/StrS family aminotransferase [Spirochaetaceae bacterium]
AKPIMVDIEEDSFNLNTDLVAKAITAHTKAIIPVDVAGLPCNYRQLFKIAHEHKNIFKAANNRQEVLGRIAIIADAAHSLGATYQGQPSGSYADLTAFSFHAVKNLTTAEGGALQISKVALKYWPNFYRELRLLSMHGQTKSALEKQTGWEYDIELAGYKCNLTDIAAALGLSQLNRYPAILAKRKAAALHYNGSFNESVFILPLLSNDGNESSYHLYLLRLQNYTEEKRNILISRLRAQGIAANVHYQPLPSLTLYKNLGYNPNHYPVAYHNYNRVISLPLFNNISPQQLDYVSKTLKQLA